MPSRELIEYLDGYSDKRWTYRLFGCRLIERDPWLDRSFLMLPDRRRFLIDVFFQRRLYSRHQSSRDRDGVALTQAWNQFLVNVERSGLEAWLKLHKAAREKYEDHSVLGACMRVHRWSRSENVPCMVWAEGCPQCHPNAHWVSQDEYERDGWDNRVSARLAKAISDLGRLVVARDEAAAAKTRQQGDAPRRTVRRGQ
jgi:hypothetical protein